MSGGWLITDEVADVLGSLEHAWRCATEAEADPEFWKWAIVALHMALQGTLVCHLTGATGAGALATGPKLDAWLQWKSSPSEPKPREPAVAALDTLLTRLQGTSPRIEKAGETFALSASEARDIRALRSYRNQIMHNRPPTWQIMQSDLSRLTASIAGIIDRIARSGWAFRQATAEQMEEIYACLAALMAQAPKITMPELARDHTTAEDP